MNLYWRVFLVWIQGLFGHPPTGILEAGRIRLRVYPHDLDMNGHMNNGRYLTILDLGRFHLIQRTGLLGLMLRKKYGPVLAAAQIRFRMPLMPFQLFDLETRVLCWDDKWIYMEQRFLFAKGKRAGAVAAIALVKGSFLDPANKSTVPTKALLEEISYVGSSPSFPPYVTEWIEAEDALRAVTA